MVAISLRISQSDRYRRMPAAADKRKEGIFCARTFAMMPSGAVLVNVGRGKHVTPDSYPMPHLHSGLSLPQESPLWLIPK
jgi:glyoxylate/hydroxypyruvate reductase